MRQRRKVYSILGAHQVVLEGVLAVQAVLESSSRDIFQILIHEKKKYDRMVSDLKRLADTQNTPVRYLDDSEITTYTDSQRHGGVIGLVGERQYQSLEALLSTTKIPFVVMLDGVEDPYNLGYALRSLYAAGVSGVVLPARNWRSADNIIVRASAGTSERLATTVIDAPEVAINYFREQGLTIITTAKSEGAQPLYSVDFTTPVCIIIGGEKRGIARAIQDASDVLVEIPYGRELLYSMGTVAATSIIAFEVLRQRKYR